MSEVLYTPEDVIILLLLTWIISAKRLDPSVNLRNLPMSSLVAVDHLTTSFVSIS